MAAQDVERSGTMIQKPLGGQTCGFWTLRPLGTCGKDSQSWPVAPCPSPLPAVRTQAGGGGAERGRVPPPPRSFPRICGAPCPSSQGPRRPSPHLSPARKQEGRLRVLALLECCPSSGLGLFGPAAPSCFQGLAGACWPPQRPELAD